MAKILVFLEHHGNELQKGALGVLSKAAQLGGDIAGVVVGEGARAVADEAGKFGASVVFAAEDPRLVAPLPQPRVDVLAKLVRDEGFETVLFAQSVLAADVAGALSARLEAGLNWDLVDIVADGDGFIGKRPALADSVYADVCWTSTPRLALFRSGSFDANATGGSAEVRGLEVELEDFSTLTELVSQEEEESTGPSIEDADVIVAGGRGLGDPEKFALVEDLARALGGAVGATRAVVDAGWYPYASQVGQTGKSVSPKLYVAVGISGAIQHKAGMQTAKNIVAVNKDPDAPIFEVADFGVVGDVFTVVPQLISALAERKR